MQRYSPVRNPRSKGIKIKHVFRICFLISVCCWFIFQIKRSHYNTKDFESVDSDIEVLSRKHSVDEVVKLGRKDVRPKETAVSEEEEEDDDEEHGVEEEKDDEIDEIEQYKFDDEEMVNETETANEAREEHYKADDASSAVTDVNEGQSLDTSKFIEHESQVNSGVKVRETGFESANVSFGHGRYGSTSTRVVEELETLLKSTNASAVVDPLTILTAEEAESEEDTDEVQHDAIDSSDVIGLEEVDNNEDSVAE
ncbi:hypothetical protein HanPI659440_Chr03g0113841 [Helianthus annuus]|nr:hypothetical protein HanPI659440_Chr03g0113841 [Helianthus annuus]